MKRSLKQAFTNEPSRLPNVLYKKSQSQGPVSDITNTFVAQKVPSVASSQSRMNDSGANHAGGKTAKLPRQPILAGQSAQVHEKPVNPNLSSIAHNTSVSQSCPQEPTVSAISQSQNASQFVHTHPELEFIRQPEANDSRVFDQCEPCCSTPVASGQMHSSSSDLVVQAEHNGQTMTPVSAASNSLLPAASDTDPARSSLDAKLDYIMSAIADIQSKQTQLLEHLGVSVASQVDSDFGVDVTLPVDEEEDMNKMVDELANSNKRRQLVIMRMTLVC